MTTIKKLTQAQISEKILSKNKKPKTKLRNTEVNFTLVLF